MQNVFELVLSGSSFRPSVRERRVVRVTVYEHVGHVEMLWSGSRATSAWTRGSCVWAA
jgi:hypothetical protein